LDGEVAVFVETLIGALKGALASERIYEVELATHHHSRSGLLGLLDIEITVVKAEKV
jgi:hypothetical protein